MAAAIAVVLCCALPILLLSGTAIFGGGIATNQQALLGVGLVVLAVGAATFLFVRRRKR